MTDWSTLSFAGDIYCAQFIITHLNSQGVWKSESRSAYSLLENVGRQIRRLYKAYVSQKSLKSQVSFLVAAAGSTSYWIARYDSPKFKPVFYEGVGCCDIIGDSAETRALARDRLKQVLESSFTGDNLILFFTNVLHTVVDRHYIDQDPNRIGISGLFTQFIIRHGLGVRVVPYTVKMYRGRIADANKGLGYAQINEVAFDPTTSRFYLVDNQSGTRTPVQDIYEFKPDRLGTVRTNFDPYQLKA